MVQCMIVWDTIVLPFHSNFDDVFDPLHLLHESMGFLKRESLKFMQSVLVNGAAHESSGYNLSTCICNF